MLNFLHSQRAQIDELDRIVLLTLAQFGAFVDGGEIATA